MGAVVFVVDSPTIIQVILFIVKPLQNEKQDKKKLKRKKKKKKKNQKISGNATMRNKS